MKKIIDITMTAVIRPEIIEMTLKSFTENLFTERKRYRLIINIDPVGDEGKTADDVLKVCHKYFNNVIYNIPNKPSFPKAVIWTWGKTQTSCIFHLEDDWMAFKPVNIKHLTNILKHNPHLACVRLYKHDIPDKKTPKLFNSIYTYNEKYKFFQAEDSKKQFGLNPVLIRKTFIDEALPMMVNNKNPEKQFRYGNEKMRDFVMRWKYAIYGQPGDKAFVWGKNGLHWRNDSKYDKPRNGKQFLNWIVK